ncbi:hypothetical protein CU669_00405 [Paramagnetospirillum kuznetsovii]|uniref:DegT/DnrJ/EryC1/StrS aminotransferase family protein n=1 Tax=Paramagnetospirillum kuznetsovii TaxID=2053833 RepID=A0A364P2P4_9PROT|nr:DegT/DnrJ/EryC1/StrS family aminotransferase [Paramagnetospirillum kuznetsovii]RAU23603.1 hypothetical protein CU669_00405 [Paramagnetospirillum kuznetsovii]
MITTAPLPSWGDLFRATRAVAADPVIISPWLKPWDSGFLSPRSSWSLAALAEAVARRHGLPARVLLPGWICNQSLWPLRQTGAEPVFLPVLADGSMDWRAAESLGTLDIVVVVHTFGSPVPMKAARDFANSRNALLVEDAAHLLMPIAGAHDVGDVVLYSPHKLLPAPEGGIVVVRPRAEGLSDEIGAALGRAADAANDWKWLAKRMVQGMIPDRLRPFMPQGGQEDFLSDPPTQPMAPPVSPSEISRRLLATHSLDHEAARRRVNEAALREVIRKTPDLRPLYHADEAIPYRLAMRATSPQAAAKLYDALRAAHLPVETWPDLPPEVAADPRHAEGAVALRRSVLLLPVHGALDPDRLAAAYAKVLK